MVSVEFINTTWNNAISADCNIVDPNNIVVEASQLPAEHGTEITYTCPPNHAKTRGNIKAICQDGKVASSSEGTSHCSKFSKFDLVVTCIYIYKLQESNNSYIYELLLSCNACIVKIRYMTGEINRHITYLEPTRAKVQRPFC